MVEPGTEAQAFKYYKETFDELGLNPTNLVGSALVDSQDLGKALDFLGYGGLKPVDLENLPSAELMQRFPNQLLSSAFFAPKITDVSPTATGGTINPGWRKVVRLNAPPGSSAQKKGVASGFLLFNKFQGTDPTVDPLVSRGSDHSNESKTTQLILTVSNSSALTRPVYFLVYGPISAGGKLITFLTASFDARDPGINPQGQYYVPQACAECHGGKVFSESDYKKLKLNYLDSDHWFDRLDDDFAFIKSSQFGVLYDGGKDETTSKFASAFDVLRRLNQEIKDQNERVEPQPPPPPPPDQAAFQLRAVRKWLQLHASDTSHQNVFARALPPDGDSQWRANRDPDRDLLPLLNQYCFRCHSSLRYSVFDRPNVVRLKSRMLDYLERPIDQKFHMPQDRILKPDVKDKLKNLITSLP